MESENIIKTRMDDVLVVETEDFSKYTSDQKYTDKNTIRSKKKGEEGKIIRFIVHPELFINIPKNDKCDKERARVYFIRDGNISLDTSSKFHFDITMVSLREMANWVMGEQNYYVRGHFLYCGDNIFIEDDEVEIKFKDEILQGRILAISDFHITLDMSTDCMGCTRRLEIRKFTEDSYIKLL